MPKKIKFIRPRADLRDVPYCDKCSGRVDVYSVNHSYYLCTSCLFSYDFLKVIPKEEFRSIPENHISQIVIQRPERKPFRPRKKSAKKYSEQIRRLEQSLRDKTSCDRAEKKQTERASARLRKANERLLKKHFRADDAIHPV